MRLKLLREWLATGCLALVALVIVPGCEKKETLIDVETPAGEVEVERNKNTGEVDVEVKKKE